MFLCSNSIIITLVKIHKNVIKLYWGLLKTHTVRIVYSVIFKDIKQYSAILRHFEWHWGIFRQYRGVRSDNQTYSELSVTFAYTTMPYWESWVIYNLRHFQKLVEHVRWSWDIDAYSATLTGAHIGGRGKASPSFLETEKSVLILERKVLILSIFWLNIALKM